MTKKPNATKVGNANRLRTKNYFEELGYDCAVVEQAKFWQFGGRRFVSKKDTFGADLLAMGNNELFFIQVKTGEARKAECEKEFAKYRFPAVSNVRKIIACWKKVKNRWKLEIINL